MKKVYVAATRQNDGKTVVSLGLLRAFKRRGKKVGYMKPVGQQYRLIDGRKIDKDVVLMNSVLGWQDADMCAMSPIAIPRGFTEEYIENPDREALIEQITEGYECASRDKDFFLIEGTGHAGVGSVFDMSNGDVAKLLGAKVVMVSLGGVGRPIDELMLNRSKFDSAGAEIAGVIVNKVDADRYERIAPRVTKGLERLGIPVLGVFPYDDYLSNPSMTELLEDLKGDLLSGDRGLHHMVAHFIIGDILPHEALDYFTGNTLFIVPGNREEMVLAALSGHILGTSIEPPISGIVFTGGTKPHPKIMSLLEQTNIPLISVQQDSFAVATKISKMIIKLRAEDEGKIEKIDAMIDRHLDVEKLWDLL
jgi:hypothetical protein